MNEQRKVIYRRRDQILADEDLRDDIMQSLAEVVDELLTNHASGEFGEEWDLDGLLTEAATYWPTELTKDDLSSSVGTDEVYDRLMGDATAFYEKREEELGEATIRDIERQVALRLIDQHWREHLYEMDYLEEGINLRALGQKDPLIEWQREGFDMFGAMMRNIARDQVRYVMHVQVVVEESTDKPDETSLSYSAPEDPSVAGSTMAAAARAQAVAEGVEAPPEVAEEPETLAPVVKTEWEKTSRNAPCPCGSGKKYKLCHGRA